MSPLPRRRLDLPATLPHDPSAPRRRWHCAFCRASGTTGKVVFIPPDGGCCDTSQRHVCRRLSLCLRMPDGRLCRVSDPSDLSDCNEPIQQAHAVLLFKPPIVFMSADAALSVLPRVRPVRLVRLQRAKYYCAMSNFSVSCSASMVSTEPPDNSPAIILRESGVSTRLIIARFNGRAPKSGS